LYSAAVEIFPGAVGAVRSIAVLEVERLLELLDLLLDFELLEEVMVALEDVWVISPASLDCALVATAELCGLALFGVEPKLSPLPPAPPPPPQADTIKLMVIAAPILRLIVKKRLTLIMGCYLDFIYEKQC
jgi:hypothetical protein